MNKASGKIILAGGSGFLGQALARHFLNGKWDVVILTRSPGQSGLPGRQVRWGADTLGDWTSELEGAAAVMNLTGKSVNCRYTARNREEILESRVNSTHVLAEAMARCAQPPPVWLNASTATFYRHTFGEPWDETGQTEASAEAKDRFSIEVARAWERALNEASTLHTRKVAMRMAMVLGLGKNSVFPVLRSLARLGLGGRMGSGRQFVSWIHQNDFCRAVEWLISHNDLEGPANLAAPNPLPNTEMMRILRQVCGVPFGLPATDWMLEVGAFVLRTETELLIKSRRVVPGKLVKSGFVFQFPTIREAFEDLNNST
ncbi:MAG TPA: TIGR01777 family oxidoreductase [Verrucomicrobiae bacterium]|nr:TIGR01777 family oxidoreductase [Verrucomicrobiae bacterium]